MAILKKIGEESAFHKHAHGRTFESGKTVYSFSEIYAPLQAFLAFLREYRAAFKAEANRYLQEHRPFVWFQYAIKCLYHPTDEDRRTFPMFFEGTWRDFDLSIETWKADKARKEERGATKNPNFVDTHKCCSNCICFYDDTPPYEWAKEDAAEAKASNNIRINWDKKTEFERQYLESDMLASLENHWASWTPTTRSLDRPLTLDRYWFEHLTTAASLAARYVDTLCWLLPYTLYFSFLWDNQDRFGIFVEQIAETLSALQKCYEDTQVWEDEVVEAARSNVRVFRVSSHTSEEP